MIWHLINAYFKYHAPWLLETLFFKASLRTDCKALHMQALNCCGKSITHTHTYKKNSKCVHSEFCFSPLVASGKLK